MTEAQAARRSTATPAVTITIPWHLRGRVASLIYEDVRQNEAEAAGARRNSVRHRNLNRRANELRDLADEIVP
jgi:hypothetical protein